MTETPTFPQTLTEFLQQTGAQVHVYDLGRRVVEIPLDNMLAIERQQAPYPYPFLRSAALGILFYYLDDEGNSKDPQIWFLKFPLDEQGLLNQVARDDFLRRIIEQLAEQISRPENEAPTMPEDNPHGFTPRDDRMASFHAKVAKQLGQAPSQYCAHALDYFHGNAGYEQWNFVGLQGIADVAARLDENDNLTVLMNAIPHLPITPLAALCSCLENEAIDPQLSSALVKRLELALQENDANTIAALIRGLSHGKDQQALNNAIYSTLGTENGANVEVLATIAGRAWHSLEDEKICHAFLNSLSLCEAGQRAFDNIMADLMFMPGLRQTLLDELRSLHDSADCSSEQATVIDQFFQSLQGK